MSATFVSVFLYYALLVEIGTTIADSDNYMSIETADKESRNPENILCRGCGSDVSSANFVISKLSPSSHYAFNDTLFNRQKILVQVVSHDFIFQFPVITTNHSTCQGFGEWLVDDSWFPGYRWRVCVCPDCGAFLGWVFESIYPGQVKSRDEIFCLVLTSIIGESCMGYIPAALYVYVLSLSLKKEHSTLGIIPTNIAEVTDSLVKFPADL